MLTYRIWRSSHSRFGSEQLPSGENDETLTALRAYTEEELSKISAAGFNAIWVHGILHHLVRVEPFPEFGQEAAQHQAAMRQLIERCARFGIRVFLYMQPPRALDASSPFWKNHPDIWGEEIPFPDITLRCLCTSTPQVREYLESATCELFRQLPQLAGVILITASEFAQHCYSHRVQPPLSKPWHVEITCPRCRQRTRAEVIAELVSTIYKGVRKASDIAEVIAWNWSWDPREYEQGIISRMPEEVVIMADFERGGHKNLLKRPNFFMDEYSLGYAGPSEKFLDVFQQAHESGHLFMAKLQLGTTHELASVVSLPIIPSLYEKARFIRSNPSVRGTMGCWNFGNALPNLNVEAFNFFLGQELPDDRASALQLFAEKRFPEANAAFLTAAWEQFQEAMFYYPFTILFLYFGVQNYTLAYRAIYKAAPLEGTSAGRSWQDDERGDDLHQAWSHPEQPALFTPEELVERLGKLAVAWDAGTSLLQRAFAGCTDSRIQIELGNALICGAVWHSAENSFRVYQLRKEWKLEHLAEYRRIAEDECGILKAVLPWVERDPRQGFHIEAGAFMFTPESIRAKLAHLENELNDTNTEVNQ